MQPSYQERVLKMFLAVVKFYMGLNAIYKILFWCFACFIGLVMLPATLGVILTIMDSMVELVRVTALIGLLCVMVVVWVFASF